jgi:predicted metal-dependent phosphotriesterase family hydrolase
MAPRVMTVSGPIPPDKLGFTLPHEHTGDRLWHLPGRDDYFGLTYDEDVIGDELRDFRRRGGGTVVDLTVPGIGRRPERLRTLSSRANVAIVMGCGWYREPYYPAEARIDERSVDQLADELVAEFEHGVDGTGVRPGIIGEIGSDKWWVSAREERVHRAAARASLRTGMAITTHSLHSDVGLAQLHILVEEGVDPGRVVIGHADTYPDLDYYLAILDRGANVQFDNLGAFVGDPVGEHREPRIIELVIELIDRGYVEQLLLSQDVCHDRHLKANGGFGYVYLQQHFLPRLRTAAAGEGDITQMTVGNPARILTIA